MRLWCGHRATYHVARVKEEEQGEQWGKAAWDEGGRSQAHQDTAAPEDEGPSLCSAIQRKWKKRQAERLPWACAQVSYHANRFCPPEHFPLQLCVRRPRRELQTKGHGGLSVGPTWAGASPVISNTLPGFPQTHSVPKRGSAPRQPCQCLEMWCHVDKIQERKAHQNRLCSFSPLREWHFAMVSNPSVRFYQTSKTLTYRFYTPRWTGNLALYYC